MTQQTLSDKRQYTAFLQWAMPQMGLRWEGFRRVRHQVIKRLKAHLHEQGLDSLDAYRQQLAEDTEEWDKLSALCYVTISRFYRDKETFDTLKEYFPTWLQHQRQREHTSINVWSAGCASGEEPYTIKLLWEFEYASSHPDIALHITATDAQSHMLLRARQASYPPGCLRELPKTWIETAFQRDETSGEMQLKESWKQGINWRQQDLAEAWPDGPFQLILCRNLAWTYFALPTQRRVLNAIAARLDTDGVLVVGKGESLPDNPWLVGSHHPEIYTRTTA